MPDQEIGNVTFMQRKRLNKYQRGGGGDGGVFPANSSSGRGSETCLDGLAGEEERLFEARGRPAPARGVTSTHGCMTMMRQELLHDCCFTQGSLFGFTP